MPIVEFIGCSGIGKSGLLLTILQSVPERNWSTLDEAARNRQIAPRFSSWEVFLLERKLRAVLATAGISVVEIYGILPFFLNKLAVDAVLRPEFEARRIVDGDPLFSNFAGEIIELARLDQTAFMALVRNRAFVFLNARPDRILRNIRERQGRGEYRIAMTGTSDTDVLAKVRGHIEKLQQIRDLVAGTGNPFIEIDFDYSEPGHERTVAEFIDRVFRAAGA